MSKPVIKLLDEWMELRAELHALDVKKHSDITDHHGRVWTWRSGDLYRHCGMAHPMCFIEDGLTGLPSRSVLTNPNYPVMCDICDPNRISENRGLAR